MIQYLLLRNGDSERNLRLFRLILPDRRESDLFLTNLCKSIRPGVVSHDGTDFPQNDLLEKLQNCSCGAKFVDVQSNGRIECGASYKTISQLSLSNFLSNKKRTFLQNHWIYFSH